MLTLPIKKKWYDMILSGIKKEEYREIKPYYERRLSKILLKSDGLTMGGKKGTLNEWLLTDMKFTLRVKFRNGYSSDSPNFIAECLLHIGTGRPEWGAEAGKRYYIFEILDIQEEENKRWKAIVF